ncbi:MAG: VOC family protein [Planctomycetota bacterium]|nr:VOC family protein [Planctomycetota bacterium]
MLIEPYLFFGGKCEEALAFYEKAVGARSEMLLRHKDAPQKPPPGVLGPGMDEKVMHSVLRIGETRVMASDGSREAPLDFKGFTLSLSVYSMDEATKYFNALADGGTVKMPLGKTFFSDAFGMLEDRFGVSWIVILQK